MYPVSVIRPLLLHWLYMLLLPMVRNTFTGLNQIDKAMCEAGIALGLTRIQRLWNIEIPLAMPTIMAGIRTCSL